MTMIEIKRNGKVFYTLEDVCDGSKLSRQLMEHHYIILKFTTVEPVYFEIGDSVEIPDFGYFELTSAYFPKQGDNGGYDYELQLDAYYMAWKNKLCKYRPQYGANETSFSLTTTIGVHMNVVLGNLKALGLKYSGKDFSVDYTTYNKNTFDTEKRFLVSYDSISILDAITTIAEALECEWWIDGSIIYLGTCEMVGQVTFEQGVNVKTMSFSESKATYITRLYAFGSDRNIPKGYFTGSETDVTTDGIATDYLMLPTQDEDTEGFISKDGYLENTNVVKNPAQAIEGVVKFDDEYPKVECSVSGIKTYDSTVKNDDNTTTTQTFWQITSDDKFAKSFAKDWIKPNLNISVKFTSGPMVGMEFELAYKVIDETNFFEIIANDNYGRTLPDKDLHPTERNKFFLYNWDSTKITDTDLIEEAQLSLLDRAKTYYKKSMISNANFDCEMDAEDFYNNGTYDYHPLGEQVKLINPMFADVDEDGNHYRNSRIIGMEINLDIPYDTPTYIVGEKAAYSKLGQLEDKVDSITVNGIQIGSSGSGGGGVYVIGLNDSTPASDSNVYSARRVRNDFLSKLNDDTAHGTITFESLQRFLQGMKVGGQGQYGMDAFGKLIVDLVQSQDYEEETQTGFGFYKRKDGKYGLNISELNVWAKAVFNTLQIRELDYVGGNMVFSPAASKIFTVKEVYDSDGNVTGWKCYLLADNGTTSTINMWHKYDQAKCQTFNIAEGVYENVSNKYYWRLVTDVSKENEELTDAQGNVLYDGQKFAWVILSRRDCENENNDAPAAGDSIVADGNRSDTDRQNLIMIETEGDNAPRFIAYDHVNSYSHTGKDTWVMSPRKFIVKSDFIEITTSSGDKVTMANYRGEWQAGVEYGYYDEVTWMGTRWLCMVAEGTTTTSEPSEDNSEWMATTAIVRRKIIIDLKGQDTLDFGETLDVICSVWLGDKEIDTSEGWSWSVERDSGDKLEDDAWNASPKAKSFNGSIRIAFTASENDLGNEVSGVYGVVFTFKAWQDGNKATAMSATLSV